MANARLQQLQHHDVVVGASLWTEATHLNGAMAHEVVEVERVVLPPLAPGSAPLRALVVVSIRILHCLSSKVGLSRVHISKLGAELLDCALRVSIPNPGVKLAH